MSLLSRLAVQAARAYGALSSNPNAVSVSYLVVAGGGGGAGAYTGGGGGAGGYQTSTATLSILNTYSITVGAGGAGTNASGGTGTSGSNSILSGTGLSTITSTGGGGGGGSIPGTSGTNGASGGSGGGGGSVGSLNGAGGTGTSGQGNNGGAGNGINGVRSVGGGGGGAGAVGGTSSSTTGGVGGAGSASSISGSSVTYAGGGGGGSDAGAGGAGGAGGGGAGGGSAAGTAATTNTGGGGGGGGLNNTGASGGSGIVIISYTSATPKFVGGTITTSGGKQIHTFTSSGTLSPITPITASYLVVAGGGGGALGGGGAGGLQTGSTTIYSGATYVVTVGGGGTAGTVTSTNGGQGNNSVLSGTGLTTLTSIGGGYGGSSGGVNGGNGGSGGGGGSGNAGGTATSGQGNNGGAGIPLNASPYSGGGGGGAGATGGTGSSSAGGSGGNGSASSITGTSVTYAGGGGGGVYLGGYSGGTAGTGGGGAGASGAAGSSGTPNLGGGGGGAGNTFNGGAGGSGVVIISYAGSQVFNGGLVTTSGGNTIHTFTSTGALTPLTNNLNNSLRFRSSASAYLSRTPTVAGNLQKWTWSGWVKKGALGIRGGLFGAVDTYIQFIASDVLEINLRAAATNYIWTTTQVFRDPSAWYHIVLAVDTTQATATNRMKLYVNGNQVTAFASSATIPQNTDTRVNSTALHTIGSYNASTDYFDGYMTDINFIDGQALEPYYFGNNDANGVWKPIQYKGTYGTNGFYLTFGNTTSTTTLGYDSSPNGNNWTCNNISLTAGTTYDAMKDVPTNTSATVANYAVLNPLDVNAVTSITEANLYSSLSASASAIVRSTIAITSGKWYWEVKFGTTGDTLMVGVCDATTALTNSLWSTTNAWMYYSNNGNKYNSSSSAYGATFTNGDIIGVALDMDAGTLVFYKNNVSQGTAYNTGLTGKTLTPTIQSAARALTAYINFGQRPFEYTPPTGFVALNTFNLPTPTILQGNKYMDATLYTGNGYPTSGTQSITNAALFKPDLVWIKIRSGAGSNTLTDSVRGVNSQLFSNQTAAQETNTDHVTAFNSNGFSLGTGSSGTYPSTNSNGSTYVGWQWQAGQGTTSSNTSGSITSTVSVNATAGFSIVTFTSDGTTAGGTVGHGLGVAPKMVIYKGRNTVENWYVYHTSVLATQTMALNTTNAAANSLVYNNTAPTSTVIQLRQSTWGAGNLVAYCFAEIAGFSKFGSYTGNGSADGPFVYTGFRPKFVMIKRTDSTGSWFMVDTSRNTYNLTDLSLYANLTDAEGASTSHCIDILSNGFKARGTGTNINANGSTYIYATFAENPFKNANAR